MSLSVPNTGATAVEASRYAVITQDRLETSWNCPPIVGSAVATMVWSRAARNIVSIRLIRMVRTSLRVSGGRGKVAGASLMSMTSTAFCDGSPAAVSDNICLPAGLCRSNLFMPVMLIGVEAEPGLGIACLLQFRKTIRHTAAGYAHGCIPRMTIAQV